MSSTPTSLGPFCTFMRLGNGVSSGSLGQVSQRHRNKHKTSELSLIGVLMVNLPQSQFNRKSLSKF